MLAHLDTTDAYSLGTASRSNFREYIRKLEKREPWECDNCGVLLQYEPRMVTYLVEKRKKRKQRVCVVCDIHLLKSTVNTIRSNLPGCFLDLNYLRLLKKAEEGEVSGEYLIDLAKDKFIL